MKTESCLEAVAAEEGGEYFSIRVELGVKNILEGVAEVKEESCRVAEAAGEDAVYFVRVGLGFCWVGSWFPVGSEKWILTFDM